MNADKDVPGSLLRSPWLWLLAAAILFSHALFGVRGATPLPYSVAGNIREVIIADDTISGNLEADGLDKVLPKETSSRLTCTADRACSFTTVRIDDAALVDDLEASGVRFGGQASSVWLPTLLSWVVPLLLLIWVWCRGPEKRQGIWLGNHHDPTSKCWAGWSSR